MKTLLILDFDRTLFNLSEFLQYSGLTKDRYEGMTAAVFEECVDDLLKGGADFIFEDADRLLDRLPENVVPVIISYAVTTEKQLLKRRLAPRLVSLPMHVTPSNKGFLIADGVHHGGGAINVDLPVAKGLFERVILVDDNPVSFEPIADSPVEKVYLDRPGEHYSGQDVSPDISRIESLNDLKFD